MSKVDAVKLSDVSFSGKKAENKEKKPGLISRAGAKLAKPVKDSFEKKYDGAAPTPESVADYTADIIIAAAATVGTALFMFAKTRGTTAGLTKSIRQAFAKKGEVLQEAAENGAQAIKKGKISQTVSKIKEGYREAKRFRAQSVADRLKVAQGENSSFITTIKDSLLNPKMKEVEVDGVKKIIPMTVEDMNPNDALSKVINKVAGKNAEKVKEGALKVGIADMDDVSDILISAGLTTTATVGAGSVAGDVTKKDDDDIADKSKAKRLKEALIMADRFISRLDDGIAC